MKNYWLISGGFVLGMGVASLKDPNSTKGEIAIQLAGGTFLTLVGIFGFKK